MRAGIIALSAATLVSLSMPGLAQEPSTLNCRLMTTADDWLFRQHCKANNFVRLAVPETVVEDGDYQKPPYLKKPKRDQKEAYKKKLYKKKHALLKKKAYLKKKLYVKKRYLKLYAEMKECKASYKCKMIVKRKLAKLHSAPSYGWWSQSGVALGDWGSTTDSGSGITNTVGGLKDTSGGITSSAANTVGNTAKGATGTVGGLLD